MDWYTITYILAVVAGFVSIIAQMRIHSIYNKYTSVDSKGGLSGAETARRLLEAAGIHDLNIEIAEGVLADHYDPVSETLRLSKEVYHGKSLSAAGIAAHEAGHAIQHFEGYSPFAARQNFVRVANIGTRFSIPIVLIGVMFMSMNAGDGLGGLIVTIGLLMFSAVVLLSLITLPVEFNASGRAVAMLENQGILSAEELGAVRQILSAAAWTYIASTLSAVLTLIRLTLMSRGGRRR